MKEMNKCRTNPVEYANIVESHIKYIQNNTDPNSKNAAFYVKENIPKIALVRGEIAFRETIEILKKLKPLNPLEQREDLQVPIPEDQSSWIIKDLISENVNKLKAKAKEEGKYTNFNFHFDIGSSQPESSFVLQLVDDTAFKGNRSKNLLSSSFKFVGINSTKHRNKHCGYFLFAC
jgi:hypothetical protein